MEFYPIPEKLLLHSATLKTPGAKNAYGDYTWTETALSRVRFLQDTAVRQDKRGVDRSKGGTLYYDCERSLPQGVSFSAGQRIVVAGEEYSVNEVKPLTDSVKERFIRITLG